MTAFSLGVTLFFAYMNGTKFLSFSPLLLRILTGSIFINPLVIYVLIFPKYKAKYSDVPFFKGKVWSVISYVLYL
jgi:hypothetical protein